MLFSYTPSLCKHNFNRNKENMTANPIPKPRILSKKNVKFIISDQRRNKTIGNPKDCIYLKTDDPSEAGTAECWLLKIYSSLKYGTIST